MAKHPRTSERSDFVKLDAALGEAERLIRAVRSMIHKTPRSFPPGGPGGGRPCRELDKAEDKIREAEFDIVGGRPCGGGTPCFFEEPPPESTPASKSHRRGKTR